MPPNSQPANPTHGGTAASQPFGEIKNKKMQSVSFLSDSQIEKIQIVVQRLENTLSELKIRNWLEQFEKADWDTAIEVLMNLEYFSSKRMMNEYNFGLKLIFQKITEHEKKIDEILKNKPDLDKIARQVLKNKRKLRKEGKNDVYIHPIGELGKSGSTMLYYVSHTPYFKHTKFKILKNIDDLNVKNSNNYLHLILLDDFSGSGDTIVKYMNEYIKPQLLKNEVKHIKIYFLCIALMKKAKEAIKEQLSEFSFDFIGTEKVAAFSNWGSPFGYRPKMLKVREFCYKYGSNLYTKVEYDKGVKTETTYPLGYRNSQSLIVFEHSVPNNTIPIIWSVQNSWKPLYPRVVQARIEEVKEFKDQTKIWLSLAKDLGYENIFGFDKDIYKGANLKLLCYIRLLKKNMTRPIITQKLNLTSFELDEVINIGLEKGVFQNENRLTKFGEQLYFNILKKLEFKKSQKVINQSVDMIYVPKIFRGKT